MDAGLVTLGAVGAFTSLVMLYYTTGILLHFVMLDADMIPRYMDRLRTESSFEVLLAGIVIFAASTVVGSVLFLVTETTGGYAVSTGFFCLVFGLLYFLHRMMRITAV